MYYKPTNSFMYLKYTSCHPKHTRKNIAGSLARRIIRIVSADRHTWLSELTNHLVVRGHPKYVISNAFHKIMQPQAKPREGDYVTFIRTFNPNHVFEFKEFKDSISKVRHPELVKAFENKSVLLTTRQPTNLRKLLTKANFILHPAPREPKLIGLFPSGKCTFCEKGYIQFASEFTFKNKRKKEIKWTYTRYFSCDSLNILYVLICINCPENYLGKTDKTKQRVSKHASDVRHPENSNCKKCSKHLRECSNMVEPYFKLYPCFYIDDAALRHFMERRFINQWGPSLNGQ